MIPEFRQFDSILSAVAAVILSFSSMSLCSRWGGSNGSGGINLTFRLVIVVPVRRETKTGPDLPAGSIKYPSRHHVCIDARIREFRNASYSVCCFPTTRPRILEESHYMGTMAYPTSPLPHCKEPSLTIVGTSAGSMETSRSWVSAEINTGFVPSIPPPSQSRTLAFTYVVRGMG